MTATRIDYSSELNPSQLEAVTTTEGPVLVVAGAGSGKTRTLVYRVAYLIEKGINPCSILLLTFTRKASREMMRRASAILDHRCAEVKGGTFHSFSNTTLRKYAARLGYKNNFTIVDRDDAENIINLLRGELGFDKDKKRFPSKGTILNVISKNINTGLSFREILEDEYPQFIDEEYNLNTLAEKYHIYKSNNSIMDYDDLLLNLLRLLKENDDISARLSRENKYIMVDEYQDTNRIQAQIASLLASEHENLLVVGDDAQSIYSFRGADFRNIMDFPKIFPATRVIALEENYRSTRPILSFANAITENFKERYAKTLFSSLESNQLPELVRPMDEEEQSAFVCERILQLSESGVPLSEIAVLFRSAWVSNELEVDLTARNIPFVKFGGLKFIEAAHIKDVLSILRIALNVSDMVAWHRTLLLLPGLGAKGAKNLVNKIAATQSYDVLAAKEFSSKKYCEELKKLHSLIKAFGSDQTNNSEEKIKEVINFYRPLMEANYDDSKKRMDDLVSFVHISSRYKDLIDFISAITLESPESSELEPSVSEKEHVVLSTIHSSKGLEWHTVFIISLVEGVLPSHYAVKKDENVEEERRLFYVAATRAKKNLYLISPEVAPARSFYSSYHSFSSESRFISEIPGLDELTARREMEDLDLGGPSEQDEDQSSSEKKNASQIKQRILQYFSKN